jgi:hypothetical protein
MMGWILFIVLIAVSIVSHIDMFGISRVVVSLFALLILFFVSDSVLTHIETKKRLKYMETMKNKQ